MFYFIGKFLYQHYDIFSYFRLVNYISFRAIMAALTAVIFVFLCSRPFIMLLHKKRIRDQARDTGLKSISDKSGTPTMGGLLIIGGVLFSMFLWGNWKSPFLLSTLSATLWFGMLGFADDLKKIRKKSGDKGLSEKTKLIFQTVYAVAFGYWVTSKISPLGKHALEFYIPFVKYPIFHLPNFVYVVFLFLFILFVANSVNLTDGLDGLAITSSLFVIGILGIFAYILGNKIYANYLYYPYLTGSGELMIVCASFVGAGLGFLWYNAYPAQIFMGDTGSLAIGATIATMCIMLKQEMVFPIAGGLFVAEALTSQIQDKIGVRLVGKRIFYRAPLHHSLQYKGLAEPKVVTRLSILSGILAILALATIKIR